MVEVILPAWARRSWPVGGGSCYGLRSETIGIDIMVVVIDIHCVFRHKSALWGKSSDFPICHVSKRRPESSGWLTSSCSGVALVLFEQTIPLA